MLRWAKAAARLPAATQKPALQIAQGASAVVVAATTPPRARTAATANEAVTTRRRPVSVMVFLPERMYSDQVGGD